jgi:hypothetical protein
MELRKAVTIAMMPLAVLACGGNKNSDTPAVKKQTAADEILRIGNLWTNVHPEKGILSPPSKISLFRTYRKSELRMSEDAIFERLTIEEEAELRDGTKIRCVTQFEHQVGHRWGHHNGDAAVEIVRPALSATRSCEGAIHPDGPIAEPAKQALFVLRSDNLVAVEPPVDQRTYTPGQL